MWEAFSAFHICIACLQPEFFRRPVVERAVRTFAVVLAPPACQGASYVIQRSEPACVEALVAQPSVEAFDMPVLHRLAGLDVHQSDLPVLGPTQHAPRSKLRTVVRAQVVHLTENWEAEFAKTFATQETRWTITRMPD